MLRVSSIAPLSHKHLMVWKNLDLFHPHALVIKYLNFYFDVTIICVAFSFPHPDFSFCVFPLSLSHSIRQKISTAALWLLLTMPLAQFLHDFLARPILPKTSCVQTICLYVLLQCSLVLHRLFIKMLINMQLPVRWRGCSVQLHLILTHKHGLGTCI